MSSTDKSQVIVPRGKLDRWMKEFRSGTQRFPWLLLQPAVLIVCSVCAFLTATSLRILWRQGVVLPWSDDWAMIPAIASKQPITLKWLWAQHNEHRIVLPKLFYLFSVRLGSGDYRYLVPGNIAVLSAAAAVLLMTIRKLRGRLSVFDVFIPLLLLNLGQGGFLWGFHFQFVSGTFLACAFLATLLWQGPKFSFFGAIFAGTCLCLLPLCGGGGLFYAIILGPWLAIQNLLQVRLRFPPTAQPSHLHSVDASAPVSATGLLLAILTVAALTLCGLYFVGYEKPAFREGAGVILTLQTSARILCSGFGMRGPDFYPILAFILSVLFCGCLALSIYRGVSRKSDWCERILFLDLATFLGAVLLLLVAVGYSRGMIWNDGMKAHYTSLASPALIAIYLSIAFVAPSSIKIPNQSWDGSIDRVS